MVKYYEIIDGGENNVYHFLFYMISNFLIANINEKIVYYYPNKANSKVSEGFLALLPPNFERHLIKDPAIEYKSFMGAIPIFHDIALPQSYLLIRHLFKAHMSPDIIPGKKTYIQRKQSATKTRTFVNEAQVQSGLEGLGYTTVCLEDLSILEQIKLVSESEFIIAAHGAALAFTVFCNQKAKVVEIYDKFNTEKKHFYHIAHVLKHGFFRFQSILEIDKVNETMLVDTNKSMEFLGEWHINGLF